MLGGIRGVLFVRYMTRSVSTLRACYLDTLSPRIAFDLAQVAASAQLCTKPLRRSGRKKRYKAVANRTKPSTAAGQFAPAIEIHTDQTEGDKSQAAQRQRSVLVLNRQSEDTRTIITRGPLPDRHKANTFKRK